MRYELSDYEWAAIKPMLPNKPRGVRRVNDRRVLSGIFWVLRSGAPWRDLPEACWRVATRYDKLAANPHYGFRYIKVGYSALYHRWPGAGYRSRRPRATL